MKKYHYSAISLAIMAGCYSSDALADLRAQCLAGVPQFQGELVKGDQTQQPVYIEADKALINQPTDATYTGDVRIKQGNRSLVADEVRVEQSTNQDARRAHLFGAFSYQDNLIQATGRDATVDLTTNDAKLGNTSYQLVGRQGRGTAEEATNNNDTR